VHNFKCNLRSTAVHEGNGFPSEQFVVSATGSGCLRLEMEGFCPTEWDRPPQEIRNCVRLALIIENG
jgi:hypothetical protein